MAKAPTPATYAQTRIAIGGLMRCCLATINDYVDAHVAEVPEPGLVLDCKYQGPGNAQIILDPSGIWRWNAPESLGAPRSAEH